jgi:Ca2+-binding RTX toxin-like protein
MANNTIDGLLGADTMTGDTGKDTYYVDNLGDVVVETSSLATEIDTVNSSVSYTLGANLENLSLTGTAVINGTGCSTTATQARHLTMPMLTAQGLPYKLRRSAYYHIPLSAIWISW